MIISIPKDLLKKYLQNQLDTFFPDNLSSKAVEDSMDSALQRVEYCFSKISSRVFIRSSNEVFFNHLHSDQYSMFLYFVSRELYIRKADPKLCAKVFYLNKVLHSIDVYYEVELPDIFCFSHCVGTVLGRAKYSDYFLVYQNCTIGSSRQQKNEENEYPVLGNYLCVYKGASILGKCKVGNNCKIASNSLLIDEDLPPDSIFIGTSKHGVIKTNKSPDHVWVSQPEA
jgi:serine O-acetyltransferase